MHTMKYYAAVAVYGIISLHFADRRLTAATQSGLRRCRDLGTHRRCRPALLDVISRPALLRAYEEATSNAKLFRVVELEPILPLRLRITPAALCWEAANPHNPLPAQQDVFALTWVIPVLLALGVRELATWTELASEPRILRPSISPVAVRENTLCRRHQVRRGILQRGSQLPNERSTLLRGHLPRLHEQINRSPIEPPFLRTTVHGSHGLSCGAEVSGALLRLDFSPIGGERSRPIIQRRLFGQPPLSRRASAILLSPTIPFRSLTALISVRVSRVAPRPHFGLPNLPLASAISPPSLRPPSRIMPHPNKETKLMFVELKPAAS